MDKKTRNAIFSKREVVKYNASRAYFGKLTASGLANAYGLFKHSQDWDKPITSATVPVGKIDGGVVCRALWYEMSYNPARFGKVSPFVYKGREDVYHFCRCGVPETFQGAEIIEKIRHKMIDFMVLNGKSKGQWYDVVNAKDGLVTISFVDGHSDDNYKVLSLLREMIRIITNQNLEDFKRKQYRNQMLTVINKRHPNGIRNEKSVVCPVIKSPDYPVKMTPEEIEEDRLDKAEESARITAENRKYVPRQQYNQARADLTSFANIRANRKVK